MSRKPFDPDRVEVPKEEYTLPAKRGPVTVAALTRMVRNALLVSLPRDLLVVGQISNLTRPASGHVYFTLKDEDSEVRCVMWRKAAAAMRFQPADGMEVLAAGYIDVYQPRGQYQLYVTRLDPRGLGTLEVAFRQLCEKLAKDGLFDPDRKKPLPAYPRTVAVVTSPTGAAVHDIIRTISRRYPCVRILVAPVQVQGDQAAGQIAQTIAQLNSQADRLGGIDVMIVGRGGGSLEDLWAFNEEVVARAIAASRIPIVSAVGHEIDTTISDMVADLRAATPTAAAEHVVPVADDLLDGLTVRQARLIRSIRSRVELASNRLAIAARCEFLRDPLTAIRQREQQLDEVAIRLRLSVTGRLNALSRRLHDRAMTLTRSGPGVYLLRRERRIAELSNRLGRAAWSRLIGDGRRVDRLATRLDRAGPATMLSRYDTWLAQIKLRLARGLRSRSEAAEKRIANLTTRLEASSHTVVLKRGFSITRRAEDGEIIMGPRQARPGARLRTETASGAIESEVVDTSPD